MKTSTYEFEYLKRRGHYVGRGNPRQLPPSQFLSYANEEMDGFKKKHGYFPDEWYLLRFAFRGKGRTFDTRDVSLYPKIKDGASWTPKDSMYTYVIEHADERSYLIRAYSALGGDAIYEQTERKRVQLRDQICYCNVWADDTDVVKINCLHQTLKTFYHLSGRSPMTWDELEPHYIVGAGVHDMNDPRAFPPKGSGGIWKPYGSKYTLCLSTSDDGRYAVFYTKNQDGLEDFRYPIPH